jgi:hypothetical protein
MRFFLASMFLVAMAAAASAREVPLPALVGHYDQDSGFERSVTIELDVAPSRVESMALYLKGTTTTGQLICFGSDAMSMWPADLSAYIHDFIENAYWYVEQFTPEEGEPLQSYDFEMTVIFRGLFGPSWDFIEAGSFKLDFSASGPPYIGICSADQAPATAIDDAVLIVNLVAHQLPIEGKSWGGVKTLF